MRLKSLELIGFKSFVDRTVVSFDEGITSVVGPNGSGKSNVVDGIRWVMGEQSAKQLRGCDMSDVIFNGSEARPATGMASVFLTFDNSDGRAPAEYASYSEITIGRRLYRSGESEYYINKVPCRLKDITEFFLGTGVGTKAYSIVEQGQVERIVSAKPEERRALLEEAAGISKFKMHRDAALRKIEATKQNLARLADIISELEHQRNSLSRQAKKAERYKEFADELKNLDLGLASHKWRQWSSEASALRAKLEELSREEASKGAALSTEETQIDSARLELTETERSLNSLQEKNYELQNALRLNEAEVKFKTDALAQRRARIEEDSREIVELKTKKEERIKELESHNNTKVNSDIELASFEETVAEIEARLKEFQERLSAVGAEVESARREAVEQIRISSSAKARIEQVERLDADITSKVAVNQTEIDSIDSKISEIQAAIAAAEGLVSEMRGTKESLSQEISRLTNETTSAKGDLQHYQVELEDFSRSLSSKKSRLSSLEELCQSYEGYHDGVKAVLKRRAESPEFSGIYGTLSEVVETEPKYETALSAALGDKLQYVVVKSQHEGVAAIDYLKTQAAGRSTFVPMEISGGETEMAASSVTGEGVIGPMLNFVKFNNEYSAVCRHLLNDIVLVEDLGKAVGVWQSGGRKNTVVTLEGDVIDMHGVLSGGSGHDSSKQFLANKREIADLKQETARLADEVASRSAKVSELRDRVQVNEARIAQLKNQSHAHEVDFVHKERDLSGMAKEIENWRRNRDRLTLETATIAEQQLALRRERDELNTKIETACAIQSASEAKVAELATASDGVRAELAKVNEELTTKKVQLAASQEQAANLDRDIKRISDDIADIERQISSRDNDIVEGNAEIESNERALANAKSEISRLVQEIDAVTVSQNELKLKYDKMTEDVRAKELALRELRRTYEDVKNQVMDLKLEDTKQTEKIFYLEREIQERYHIDLASRNAEFSLDIKTSEQAEGEASSTTPSEAEQLQSIEGRVTELKEKIEKIGAVNTDAINEYQGVAERYDFLMKQSEDLKTSIDTLQKAIIRINRTSKERFFETFNAVNDRFKTLFPRLFHGGGKAELILTDQENILESGIEIVAQPPGKKLQSVGLLSGGEKALVAITFIFSIFLIKPSPFCLLDEVDAPLDDANIDRFNQLVREMSNLSQFIMITHNRRTMELADTLYGVTMEDPGISKIVSVKLENRRSQQPETQSNAESGDQSQSAA